MHAPVQWTPRLPASRRPLARRVASRQTADGGLRSALPLECCPALFGCRRPICNGAGGPGEFQDVHAGVGAVDVRDPFNPKEIASFVPALNKNTVVLETPAGLGANMPVTEASKRRAIQTNNVDVDDRGFIYIVDRANSGMHILELTGTARAIANWSAAAK